MQRILTRIISALTAIVLFAPTVNAQATVSTISTTEGSNMVYTCPGDEQADVITFEAQNASPDANYQYVITDETFTIIGLPPANSQDFEGAGEGVCYVWGFSYTGDLIANPGDNVFTTLFSTGGWAISSTAIRVVRAIPDGGTVAMPSGNTERTVCTTDSYDDVIIFTTSSTTASQYRYVITDDQNNILGLPPSNAANFEGVPPGVCRVWGLAFTGNITAEVGQNAAEVALSDGCFDLSDNFITVNRTDVDGGTVTTTEGETTVRTVPGDGNPDVITFQHESSSEANFAYIITDDNNIVLGVPPGNSQDFEGAGEGTCLVWGVSYTGDLRVFPGDDIFDKALSSDCADLSDTPITVIRSAGLSGGTVAMPSGATVRYTCPGDGVEDIVMFVSEGATEDANFTYVITDDQFNILGVPPANSQDFEGAGEGTCLVWGLAYTGNLTAQVGDNAAQVELSDGEFALSENVITVHRFTPNGGTVATTSGETEVNTIPGDNMADIVEFVSEGASISNFTYVITDDQNNILGIPPANSQDFEGAGVGICRVWGLAFTGSITAQVGDNAAAVALTDDCFDLSDNFITVYRRTELNGGTVAMPSGATERYTCPGDGVEDVVMFVSEGASSGASFAYVITDDQNNILGLPPGNSQDFEGAGEGVCRVWGLSYTGTITAQQGDNAAAVALSDGLFALSENFITINRATPEGGTVATIAGETTVTTIAGDGSDDIIEFASEGTSNSNFTYVITDNTGMILGIPPSNSQNFEGAGPGICYVWGLSYTGEITAMAGDNALEVDLSSDCFDLSDNFITVNRLEANQVDGGTVAMPSGATVRYTCPGDGVEDIVMFVSEGATEGASFTYVITDDQNNILGIPPSNSQDFEGAGPGICYVWGLAYTGEITAMVGDNAASTDLSNGLFDLSDNFIIVNRDIPNGGTVTTINGETEVTTTAGDGNDDIIEFASEGTSNSNFTYVITDDQNIILGIPPANSQNFEGAGEGVCRVWGLAFTGNVTAEVGDNAAEVALTDECFDLSDNFITVTREAAPGIFNAPVVLADALNQNQLEVYPNPANADLNLNINLVAPEDKAIIRVVDLLGRVVFQQQHNFDAGLNNRTIDIQELPNGNYFLQIATKNEAMTSTFVKE